MNKVMEHMALTKPMVRFDMSKGHYPAQATSPDRNVAPSLAAAILELTDDPMGGIRGAFGREQLARALVPTYEVPKPLAACAAEAAERRHRPSSPLLLWRSDAG